MRRISEEITRKEMNVPPFVGGIDPQLERAGWYLRDYSKVKIEIPADGYGAEPWNGVSDYTLSRENGEVYVWRGCGGEMVYSKGNGRFSIFHQMLN